jgi:hypothetical protein
MSAGSALRRLLELEAPRPSYEGWKKVLYWIAWAAMAGTAAALILATLNHA